MKLSQLVMQRFRGVSRLALAIAIGLALTTPAQANLVVNGGFEDGDLGPINGAGVPANWYAWGEESGYHHDDDGKTIDTKAIKFWWDNVGVWQDFAVVGGIEYQYSVQAMSVSDDPLFLWNGLLQAEFYDSSIGTDPGDVLLQVDVDRFFSASDPQDTWVELGGAVVAPANADIGRISLKLEYTDWEPHGSLNFDNASVTPEPASLLLLGIGGMIVLRRRSA